MTAWPSSEKQLNAFYGDPNKGSNSGGVNPAWEKANIVSIAPPYKMVEAWPPYRAVNRIRVHRKCADDLSAVLAQIKNLYGSQTELERRGLHKYGGCYVFRLKRGGSTLSTHSWGCAIDLDPERNGFGVKYKNDGKMMPLEVVKIFEDHGWTWGGPWRTADAMHFQAVGIPGQKRTTKVTMVGDAPSVSHTESPNEPAIVVQPRFTDNRRTRMGQLILNYEAGGYRDSSGHIQLHRPPANDGGGSYEYAGINVRYHPEQAKKLKALVEAGEHDLAEASAIEYILSYTDKVAGWTTNAGVEFSLRDCAFNRGPTGAAIILQLALGVEDDGIVGPETREALSKHQPVDLIRKIRAAREQYELRVAGKRENMWKGLNNRWNNCEKDSIKFAAETPTPNRDSLATGVGTGGTTIGTGAAVETVRRGVEQGWTYGEWFLVFFAFLLFGCGVYLAYDRIKRGTWLWQRLWGYGQASQAQLPHTRQNSEPSLGQPSEGLSGVSLEELQEMQSRLRSVSKQPPKPSAKKLPSGKTPAKSSKGSKKKGATK